MFHKVPEGKTVKNRVRFDLQAADIAAEADRLTGLGSQQIRSLLAKPSKTCLRLVPAVCWAELKGSAGPAPACSAATFRAHGPRSSVPT
jgi:Glyoxalase-like domain